MTESAAETKLEAALYVVATPIGNLEDITLRALRILKQCDLIASEDTRTTLKLLSHFEIATPLTSYHQHSKGSKAADIALQIAEGKSVALVSEAGTPAISDPGMELIGECIERGIKVYPVPGACALIAFVCAAGLDTRSFVFLGFPPRKPGDRLRFFESLAPEQRTLVFYESPNRTRATLGAMLAAFGDRQIVIGRELTKLHEEFWRGSLSEAVAEFGTRRPRGEFVIGVVGSASVEHESGDLEQEFRNLCDEGIDQKTALARLARKAGLPRRELYAMMLEWKDKL